MSSENIGRAVLEIAIDDKQYKFVLGQMPKENQKTAKQVKGIWEKELDGAAFVKFGGIAVAAVGAVAAGIVALGQRGAAVDDAAVSFGVLSQKAGETADVMLGALREGVVGAMSDTELMMAANSALGAELVKSADDMGALAAGARALAKATGGTTADAFETLTNAIASGRTASLKQLGIFVDSKVALQDYAGAMGKSVSDLTDQERAAALSAATVSALRDRLREIPPDAADFGEVIDAAKAHVVNFTDGLAVAISQSPALRDGMLVMADAIATAFGGDQTETIAALVGWVNKFAAFVVDAGEVSVEVARFIMGAWTGLNVLFNTVLAELISGMGVLITAFHDWVEVAAEWDIPGARESLSAVRDMKNMVDGAAQSFRDQAVAAVESAGRQTLALDSVKGVLTAVGDAIDAAADQTQAAQQRTESAFDGVGVGADRAAARTVEASRKIAETMRALEAEIAVNQKVGLDKRLAELDAARGKEIAGLQNLKELTGAEYDQMVALITTKYAQLAEAARLGGDEIRDRHIALQQEIAIAEATGTQQRLLQIEAARQNELQGLEYLKTNYGAQYELLASLVHEKYQQMTAAATGHGLSVEQAAAAAGFKTRDELEQTAQRAVETYNQMKASGLFTAKETEAAFIAAEVAKREAKGQTVASFMTSEQALVTGSLQILGVLGEKNKVAAIAGALINTYLAVTKAYAAAPWPANLVLAAGALAAGMSTVAKIRASDPGGFREGTPGLDFMDFGGESFHALHGREAVIPQGGGHALAGEIASSMDDGAQLARLDSIARSLEDLPREMQRAFTRALQASA